MHFEVHCYDLEFSRIFMNFEEKDKMLDMIRFTGIQPSAYIKLLMQGLNRFSTYSCDLRLFCFL